MVGHVTLCGAEGEGFGMTTRVWLDIETTGLNPIGSNAAEILEVGVVVVDSADPWGSRVAENVLIRPTRGIPLDPWILRQHGQSGLLAAAVGSGMGVRDAELHLLDFIKEWSDGGRAPGTAPKLELAGSSVHFDRGFLRWYMPELEAEFGHRHYDVSSQKLMVVDALGEEWADSNLPKGRGLHRAIPDIEDSMELGAALSRLLKGVVG